MFDWKHECEHKSEQVEEQDRKNWSAAMREVKDVLPTTLAMAQEERGHTTCSKWTPALQHHHSVYEIRVDMKQEFELFSVVKDG
jgi:hypothetical protein